MRNACKCAFESAHDLLSIEKSDLFEKHIKNQYFFCDGVTSVMDKIKNVFCRLTSAHMVDM